MKTKLALRMPSAIRLELLCLLLIFLLPVAKALHAQQLECGVGHMSTEYRNYMISTVAETKSYHAYLNRTEPRDIAVNAIIVNYEDGPIVNTEIIQQQIDAANIEFATINMHFSLCNVQYVDYPYEMNANFVFPFWNYEIQEYITDLAYIPGYLNVFYGTGAGPWAGFPTIDSWDGILMNNGPHYVFIHELAHYFSLYHTHAFNGYSTTIYTQELVDGSNCETEGDFICDTPADPGLYGRIAPAPSCEYIDTVSVDANGDLYQPLTDNYMCATNFECFGNFTPQQFSRMAYCMDHERAHLKSGSLSFAANPLPLVACITDEPIQLTGNGINGTFSGPGVVDNVFYPDQAGNGHHIITYTAEANEEIVETTDAYYNYRTGSFDSTEVWQSFTAGMDGTLNAFAFSLRHSVAQDILCQVYSGTGTSGTLLGQGSLNVPVNTGFDWTKIVLDLPVDIEAGSVYTAVFSASEEIEIASTNFNPYEEGMSIIGSDVSFITYVLPDAPNCGNSTVIGITIGEPTPITYEALLPLYCESADASEVLFYPTGGTTRIDGVEGNIIDPAALGGGLHTASYEFENDFGCSVINDFEIHIAEGAETGIDDNTVFCTVDSILPLNLQPANGLLYLDDVLVETIPIYTSDLGNDLHELTYITSNEYIWHDTLDQAWSPNNPFNAWAMNDNVTMWQSFTPSMDGYIDRFGLGFYANAIVELDYALFKGNGVDGELIHYDSTSFGAQSTYIQYFDFPNFTYLLEADSIYTVACYFGATYDAFVMADVFNSYPGGTSSYAYPGSDIDFKFEEYINPIIACAADTALVHFSIGQQMDIEFGENITATEGSEVTLDAGESGNEYLWSTGDVSETITFVPVDNPTLVWVEVTNPSGCSDRDSIYIDLVAGIESLTANTTLILFPNPVETSMTLQSEDLITAIEIFDLAGKLIFADRRSYGANSSINIPTTHLAVGSYNLRCSTSAGYRMARFIKL